MKVAGIARALSAKGCDLGVFVEAATLDESVRDEIVRLMIADPGIMVYYHCFSVVSRASQEHPELFYRYWQALVPLLKHENSYHRDFALTILANLTAVDGDHRFRAVYRDYFAHVHDPKFMTARCCVQNAAKVIANAPEFGNDIAALLMDLDHSSAYTAKQQALLTSDVLVVLEGALGHLADRVRVMRFVAAARDSISPRARNKAREMARRFCV